MCAVALVSSGLVAVGSVPSPAGAQELDTSVVPAVVSPVTEVDGTPIKPVPPPVPIPKIGDDFTPDPATEVVDERTDRAKFFVQPDGTKVAALSATPVHYQDAAGEWVDIDSRVVADPERAGWFESKANAWTARFGPLPYGVSFETAAGTQTMAPKDAAAVAPERGTESNVIIYRDVWPHVDLRYTVGPEGVEEEIVVHTQADRSRFEFSTSEAFVANPDEPGGLEPAVERPGVGRFLAPIATTGNGRPLDNADATLTPTSEGGAGVAVAVDPAWLSQLDADRFPIAIDPTWSTGPFSSKAYKSDGYSCTNCGVQIGNSVSAGNTYWRTTAYFPYESLFGAYILDADLVIDNQVAGTANSYTGTLWHASASTYAGAIGNGQLASVSLGAPTYGGVFESSALTAKLNAWTTGSVGAQILGFTGAESPGVYTYKKFNSATLYVFYSNKPPTPAPLQPKEEAVANTTNLTFTAGGVNDPNGETVYYQFQVATGGDGQTGRVATSPWQANPVWTPPSGTFVDGGKYTWVVRSRDEYWLMSPWSAVQNFRIDYGLGRRSTLPYDELGGAAVNLSNGNLTLSTGGPTFSTVGGPVGVTFTYNSQAPRRTGLYGDYAADVNHNGQRDSGEAAGLHRLDPTINFAWASASPAPDVLDEDWFTARWTGYLKAAAGQGGSYVLVSDNTDDSLTVKTGNPGSQTTVLATTACCVTTTGSTFTLSDATPGLPIDILYAEKTGAASVRLKIRKASDPAGTEVDIPTDWFTPDAPSLPDGWSRTGDSFEGGFAALRPISSSATVAVDDTGADHLFAWTGTAWAPPPGQDQILTQLADGKWTLDDAGTFYEFDVDGHLVRITAAADDLHPGAPTHDWSDPGTGPVRLESVTDAYGRQMTLRYGTVGDACPTGSGYDTDAPTGMLCQVEYPGFGGGSTDLYYSNGHFARIDNPGDATVRRPRSDFGYDSQGRLKSVRDAFTNDLITANTITDNTTYPDRHQTLIAYDSKNRVRTVTAPVKDGTTQALAERAAHSYRYTNGPEGRPVTAKVYTAGLPESPPPGGYTPLVAKRILDTRYGQSPSCTTCQGTAGALTPQATTTITVPGWEQIPTSGVDSVVLNVAVTGPTAAGWLNIYPSSEETNEVPIASYVNFASGQTIAGLVVVKLGTGGASAGKVKITNSGNASGGATVHVIADVAGWYASSSGSASGFVGVNPQRILDTRNGTGTGGSTTPVAGGATLTLDVAGVAPVSGTGATSVVINVAVTAPTTAGALTVYPASDSLPNASNMNFAASQTLANLVVVKLGTGGSNAGKIKFKNWATGTVHVIGDVVGYFKSQDATTGLLTAFSPTRLLDTRNGTGVPGGTTAPLAAGATLTVNPADAPGMGALEDYSAVVVNVAATAPTVAGALVVYSSDLSPAPSTSNLNFAASQTIANLAMTKIGADGKFKITNQGTGTVHVIADLSGAYGNNNQGLGGLAQTINLDTTGHATQVLDTAGIATDIVWDGFNERILKTTDHHYLADPTGGLVATTIYDAAQRPTDSYGPGPSSEFPPGSTPSAPHSVTRYDEGLPGLNAAWYDNPNLAGAPSAHTRSFPTAPTPTTENWGSGSPAAGIPADGFSGRLTGEIQLSAAAKITVTTSGDGASLYVDDKYQGSTWGGAYRAAILKDDPDASWRLGEAAGPTLHDSQGLYPGTYSSNGVTYGAAGITPATDPDTAVTFNGTSGSAQLGTDSNVLNGRTTVSVEAWFKVTTATNAGPILGYQTTPITGTAPATYTNALSLDANGKLRGQFNGTSAITTAGAVSTGTWHHAVITHTGTSQCLYLDGSPVGSCASGSLTWSAMDDAQIGAASTGSAWKYFAGTIDEVAVYPAALTSTQVAAHYAAQSQSTSTITGTDLFDTTPHRIRIDYQDPGGNATLTVGVTTGSTITALRPRYDLVTSTTDPDEKSTAFTYGTEPWLGLTKDVIVDPGVPPGSGLALTTTTTYETAGADKYQRRLSRMLPAGNVWAYDYYDGSASTPDTADNPCTPGTTEIIQAGALKTRTGPDPDANPATDTDPTLAPRVEEFVYDAAGRILASRVQADGANGWACLTYDARGRPTTKKIPAFGAQTGTRTITYDYGLANPTTTSVSDGGVPGSPNGGTITTITDWLGRVISYTDVWNQTTTTAYDQLGRVTTSDGPETGTGDAMTFTYTAQNRLATQSYGGNIIAQPAYHAASGIMTGVTYPSGSGNAGNGTTGAFTYDTRGRSAGITWNGPSSTLLTANTVTRSPAGRVATSTTDAGTPSAFTGTYTYDAAGRLDTATAPGHSLNYDFASSSGCGTLTDAGDNTNRTSVTDNAGTPITYCYDHADRLTSTTEPSLAGTIGYDRHGNTTLLGGQTFTYDGADRHLSSAANGTTVTYTRDATDRIVARHHTGPGTITWRGTGTPTQTNGTSTTVTINRPATTQNGDILIAHLAVATDTTITAPTGWTQITTAANGTGVRGAAYWHLAAAGDPTSWDWTLAAAQPATASITAYTGVDPANPVDVFASASATGTTSHVAPAVTTTTYGDLLISAHALTGTTSLTPPAGSTERADASSTGTTPVTAEQADANLAAAGATGTRTATSATSADSVSITLALKPATITDDQRYGYTGGGDSPSLTLNASSQVVERSIGLPGGASVTKRATGDVWSYPNIHGDIVLTANASGTKTGGTFQYDPYGNALSGLPDNSDGAYDNGWLGKYQRGSEHPAGMHAIVEMGARPYLPNIGRFLEVDPIEGGSANDYSYVSGDPVGTQDLDGREGTGLEGLVCALTLGPDVCAEAAIIQDYIIQVTGTLFSGEDPAVGAPNAFRHALGSALLTIEFGAPTAKTITDSHEFFIVDSHADTLVDQHNNAVGRQLGKTIRRGGLRGNSHRAFVFARMAVQAALNAGQLCPPNCSRLKHVRLRRFGRRF